MTLFKQRYRIESSRLPGWDYASAGWYFVTLCTGGRECFFGDTTGDHVRLSPIGEIARGHWVGLPRRFSNARLDEFVIMPNHIHAILVLAGPDATSASTDGDVARRVATSPCISRSSNDPASPDVCPACNVSTEFMSAISPKSGSLAVIIRTYKSAVSRWCNSRGYPTFAWQPRFYDHIIRDNPSLQRIRAYIRYNPAKWQLDPNNPAAGRDVARWADIRAYGGILHQGDVGGGSDAACNVSTSPNRPASRVAPKRGLDAL